jgi:RNA polymerase sigma-70 factor (ECF subfamily)
MLAKLPRCSVAPGAEQLATERMYTDEVVASVQRALKSLKPMDAALATLTMFEGFTPAEAAETLGISAGTARTRLHRARVKMANELGNPPEGFTWEPGWEGAQ